MKEYVVIDIGTTNLKVMIFNNQSYKEYYKYKLDYKEGEIYIDRVLDIIKPLFKRYRYFILTGLRASVMGWNGNGTHSNLYTWRFSEADRLRFRYVDPDDELLNLFIRPGSAALRIKYLQDMGYEYVGGVESYVTWLLTGRYVVDHSYAHTYGLYDPFTGDYLEYILDRLELDRDRLPEIIDSYNEDLSGEAILEAMIPDQSAALIAEYKGDFPVKSTLGSGAFIDLPSGGEIIGDPFKGIYPILAFISNNGKFYMGEAFIFEWGSALDNYLEAMGYSYEDIDLIDLKRDRFRVYPPVLRSTIYPNISVESFKSHEFGLHDVIYSLAAGVSYLIDRMKDFTSFKYIYVNGGGALSKKICWLIANSTDVEVRVNKYPELATLIGAYLYYVMRSGGDIDNIAVSLRPEIYRFGGSKEYSWIIDVYREYLSSL